MVSKAVAKQTANVPVLPCGGGCGETVGGLAAGHGIGRGYGGAGRLAEQLPHAQMLTLLPDLG